MDILLPAISHENEPSFSARMCCTHSVQCSSLATFHMACTDFEPVLECGASSVLQNRTQGTGISPSPSQAGGAPLFAIRVCLLLVVPFFFLGDCVGDSGSVPVLVAQAGGYFPTTYVAAIKKKERASIQRAIVTGRALRDPTEQMLHKLDSFSAFEGEEEMRSKSPCRFAAALP